MAAVLTLMITVVVASAASAQLPSPASNTAISGLDALVQEALLQNPSVIAARQRWEALMRVPIQQDTLPRPKIEFQNLAVGNAIPGNGLQTNSFAYFGYGVSQDIPFPGKLRLRAAVAQRDADAAHAAYVAEQRQVVEQVRETYFNLFYFSQTLGVLQRTREDLRGVERITQSQYEVGTAQQQDVLKAQLEITSILAETETTREEFGQAQADLKSLLGREQDSPEIPIENVKLTAFKLDRSRLHTLAMANSPEVKQARELEAKSADSLKLAREGYLPDFTIAYLYEKTGAAFPDYYMATIGVKIPLYFWRKQTPAIEQAGLEKGSAHAQTRAVKLSVLYQARNQLIAIRTTRRVARIYRQGLIPQAQATLASASAAYQVGKVDFQTLLSAEIDVLRLKQQYYRTVADHEIAVAKIQQIIGNTL
ncbi:MAG: TolC family protein [Candidatus Binataceae bacterium]